MDCSDSVIEISILGVGKKMAVSIRVDVVFGVAEEEIASVLEVVTEGEGL